MGEYREEEDPGEGGMDESRRRENSLSYIDMVPVVGDWIGRRSILECPRGLRTESHKETGAT